MLWIEPEWEAVSVRSENPHAIRYEHVRARIDDAPLPAPDQDPPELKASWLAGQTA